MKIGKPVSRYDLKISKRANVLDVGSGHNPHPRANVIIDKFDDSNFHRSGDIKVLKKQRFVNADGERMPFSDKEFDFVICCHVLEHVDNPNIFLDELGRVGKAGYLETPSLMGEYLIPKASHKHVILDLHDKIVVVSKERLRFVDQFDFGDVFLEYLPKHSIGFKILQRTYNDLFTVNYQWEDSIDYIIDPNDEELSSYFTTKWNEDKMKKIFGERSLYQEFLASTAAGFDIIKSVFKSKILKKG